MATLRTPVGQDEFGASAVEYALIVVAIAAVVVAAAVALGSITTSMFSDTCSQLDSHVSATAAC